MNIEIGSEVYLVGVSLNTNEKDVKKEKCVVTKIGNKYILIKDEQGKELKCEKIVRKNNFHFAKYKNGWFDSANIYLSEKEYLEELEYNELIKTINFNEISVENKKALLNLLKKIVDK